MGERRGERDKMPQQRNLLGAFCRLCFNLGVILLHGCRYSDQGAPHAIFGAERWRFATTKQPDRWKPRAEVVSLSGQEPPKVSTHLPFCEHNLRRDFSLSDCAVGTQSCEPNSTAWNPHDVTIFARESPGVRRLGTNRRKLRL